MLEETIIRAMEDEGLIEELSFENETSLELDFSGIKFTSVRFTKCHLNHCSFSGARFNDVFFEYCDISNCSFADTFWRDSNIKGSKSIGSSFRKNYLHK